MYEIFYLGGHSPIATRFIFQAREAPGVETTLRMHFARGPRRRGWPKPSRGGEEETGIIGRGAAEQLLGGPAPGGG